MEFNPLLEQRIEEYYQMDGEEEALIRVLETILAAMAHDGHVLIPAEPAGNVPAEEDLRKLTGGGELEVEGDLQWNLIHFIDDRGVVSMPVFTSREKLLADGPEGCEIISFFLDEYMRQILEAERVEGLLINPGEHSFFLNKETINVMLQEYKKQ